MVQIEGCRLKWVFGVLTPRGQVLEGYRWQILLGSRTARTAILGAFLRHDRGGAPCPCDPTPSAPSPTRRPVSPVPHSPRAAAISGCAMSWGRSSPTPTSPPSTRPAAGRWRRRGELALVTVMQFAEG